MKLSTAHTVESNVGNTSTFKIAANAKAFMALSSTLYSNKVRSILRELGCNAQDSHKEAGVSRPIDVKLPNALNPSFYVKDYGVGLDEKGILELYTTYFSSSKDQSNDLVGAFGLGSKSPFAYTDSFTVETVKNGVHYTFAIFIGPNGEPQVAKISEKPATPEWPSGLMVSFPVASGDFPVFEREALDVFQWFDPLPQLLGTTHVVRSAMSAIPAERLYPSGALVERTRRDVGLITLVMGGVAYPVDHTKIGQLPFSMSGSETERVILFANIGEVEVSISRESLSLTPATLQGIQRLFARLSSEILAKFASTGSFLEDFRRAKKASPLAVSVAAQSPVDRLRLRGEWPTDLSRWDASAKSIASMCLAARGDGFCIQRDARAWLFYPEVNQAVIALISEDTMPATPEPKNGKSPEWTGFWGKVSTKLRQVAVDQRLSVGTQIRVLSVAGNPDPEKFREFGCLVVVPADVKVDKSTLTANKKTIDSVDVLQIDLQDIRSRPNDFQQTSWKAAKRNQAGVFLLIRNKSVARLLSYQGSNNFGKEFVTKLCSDLGIVEPDIIAFPESLKNASILADMGFVDLAAAWPADKRPLGVLDIRRALGVGDDGNGLATVAIWAAVHHLNEFRSKLNRSQFGRDVCREVEASPYSGEELVYMNRLAQLAVFMDSCRSADTSNPVTPPLQFNDRISVHIRNMNNRVTPDFPFYPGSPFKGVNYAKSRKALLKSLQILAIIDPV